MLALYDGLPDTRADDNVLATITGQGLLLHLPVAKGLEYDGTQVLELEAVQVVHMDCSCVHVAVGSVSKSLGPLRRLHHSLRIQR